MIYWLCVHISWVVCSGLPCQRARSPGAPTQYVGLPSGEKVLRAGNQPFLDGYCSDLFTLPGCSRRRATELYSPSWRVLLSREMQIYYSHCLHWHDGGAHALCCRPAVFPWYCQSEELLQVFILFARSPSPPHPQVSCGPAASPEPAGCPMPGWLVKSPLGSPLEPGWSPASETPPLCARSWPPSSFRRATKTILLFN